MFPKGLKNSTYGVKKNGTRILKANGMDEWQKQLNFTGLGHSGADFVSPSAIEGRVCPPRVFIDQSNKFTQGNCLYYSHGYLRYTQNGGDYLDCVGVSSGDPNYWSCRDGTEYGLDEDGTSQINLATLGLNEWSNYGSAKWYVGNIKTCGIVGMRLPTIYETTTTDTSETYYPFSNGTPPAFAGVNGVPDAFGLSWTASSYTENGKVGYWNWNSSSSAFNGYYYHSNGVRCVLP